MNVEELMSILGEEKAKLNDLTEKVERQEVMLGKIQTNYEDLSERFLLALKVLNQMHEAMVPLVKCGRRVQEPHRPRRERVGC